MDDSESGQVPGNVQYVSHSKYTATNMEDNQNTARNRICLTRTTPQSVKQAHALIVSQETASRFGCIMWIGSWKRAVCHSWLAQSRKLRQLGITLSVSKASRRLDFPHGRTHLVLFERVGKFLVYRAPNGYSKHR